MNNEFKEINLQLFLPSQSYNLLVWKKTLS